MSSLMFVTAELIKTLSKKKKKWCKTSRFWSWTRGPG